MPRFAIGTPIAMGRLVMPGIEHEALVELFRTRPSLAAELLREAFGVELDFDTAETRDSTLSALPTEYRADHVVVLERGGTIVAALIVEVQLSSDDDKRWKWPAYVAVLSARLRCVVHLAIVTTDESVAKRAAQPIELGPLVLRPWVFGPATIPHVTDFERARGQPELSVLSVLTHGNAADAAQIAAAALFGLGHLDPEHRRIYYDLIAAALPSALLAAVEDMMKTTGYEYRSDFARQYFGRGKAEGLAEGKAEGKAEGLQQAILACLSVREVPVTDTERARIIACTDATKLEAMVAHAVTARSAAEVLRDA